MANSDRERRGSILRNGATTSGDNRTLQFYGLDGQFHSITYRVNGQENPEALRILNALLGADPRRMPTGEPNTRDNPAAFYDLIHQVASNLPAGNYLHLTSSFRSAAHQAQLAGNSRYEAVSAATSPHVTGHAADFTVAGTLAKTPEERRAILTSAASGLSRANALHHGRGPYEHLHIQMDARGPVRNYHLSTADRAQILDPHRRGNGIAYAPPGTPPSVIAASTTSRPAAASAPAQTANRPAPGPHAPDNCEGCTGARGVAPGAFAAATRPAPAAAPPAHPPARGAPGQTNVASNAPQIPVTSLPTANRNAQEIENLFRRLGGSSVNRGHDRFADFIKEAKGISARGAQGFDAYQRLSDRELALAGNILGLSSVTRNASGGFDAETMSAIRAFFARTEVFQKTNNASNGTRLTEDGVFGRNTGAAASRDGYSLFMDTPVPAATSIPTNLARATEPRLQGNSAAV
jgi:uncharacterized protein YcbK (DUF882 family)